MSTPFSGSATSARPPPRGGLALVEHGPHLPRDGHLDARPARPGRRRRRRAHALRHHAAARQRPRPAPVPRPSAWPRRRLRERRPVQVRTRSPRPARPDRVSGRPPSATARRVISARPAGDEGGHGVVAVAQAVDDAGRDGDHVLERARELDAHHVVAGVGAERAAGDGALDRLGHARSRRRHHDRGGLALRDLQRERRARRARPAAGPGSSSAATSRHALQRLELEPLGGRHQDASAGSAAARAAR